MQSTITNQTHHQPTSSSLNIIHVASNITSNTKLLPHVASNTTTHKFLLVYVASNTTTHKKLSFQFILRAYPIYLPCSGQARLSSAPVA
jgi:hypothetical protein